MAMTSEERRRRVRRSLRSSSPAYGNNYRSELYNGDLSESDRAQTARTRRYTSSSRSSRARRNRKRSDSIRMMALIVVTILLVTAAVLGVRALWKKLRSGGPDGPAPQTTAAAAVPGETESAEPETTEPAGPETQEVLEEARLRFAMYDYDEAEKLLKSIPGYETNGEVQEELKKIEEIRPTLVRQNIREITHVFFHILTVDPVTSYDSNKWGKQAGGYNSLMTTIPEFEKIIQSMYDKGFVIVSLHDMAYSETVDGKEVLKEGDILLPPGKQAFVMSEDDVCYYEYMKGAGYADKMIIGDDGRPTLHYTDPKGNEFVGDYDLVPILDKFIDKHPDFSYKGHKAAIAFTGYNGILGYRTDETYLPENYQAHKVEGGHDVEAERKEAVEVLKALVADGYDLTSHSWGHRDMGQIPFADFKRDCDRWEKNVNSLIKEATGKPCDIMIYPKGADVNTWHPYTHDNERFNYMHDLGFRYFCNVDSTRYWVQKGDDWLRQGRRALDGYNIYYDMVLDRKGTPDKKRLTDLFDAASVFDDRRPTPVPNYAGTTDYAN